MICSWEFLVYSVQRKKTCSEKPGCTEVSLEWRRAGSRWGGRFAVVDCGGWGWDLPPCGEDRTGGDFTLYDFFDNIFSFSECGDTIFLQSKRPTTTAFGTWDILRPATCFNVNWRLRWNLEYSLGFDPFKLFDGLKNGGNGWSPIFSSPKQQVIIKWLVDQDGSRIFDLPYYLV